MAHPKIDGRPFLISLCSLSLSLSLSPFKMEAGDEDRGGGAGGEDPGGI